MSLYDLISVCPATQTIFIIESGKKLGDMYNGYMCNIPEELRKREVYNMYSAYYVHKDTPVLVVTVKE